MAEVLLQRASTTALLQYCGQHYPRLQAAAGRAKTRWLQRNRQVLQRADRLREQLLRGIKREQSRFAAELLEHFQKQSGRFALPGCQRATEKIREAQLRLFPRLLEYIPSLQTARPINQFLSPGHW